MDPRQQERTSIVVNQLVELNNYDPYQEIDENLLKEMLDRKKRGVFDPRLFEMIINQTKKLNNERITIQSFAEVYCQAEDNLVDRSQKIEQAILDHRKKQEEFTR
jgi:hypothetical protein